MISALAASLHHVSQPTVTANARHEFCLSSETILKLEFVTLFDCGSGQTPTVTITVQRVRYFCDLVL